MPRPTSVFRRKPSPLAAQEPTTLHFGDLDKVMNPIYYKYLFTTPARFILLKGGGGSGKSRAVAQAIAFWAMTEFGHNIFMVRKVLRTCRESVWRELKISIAQLGMSSLWKFADADMRATFLLNGNEVQCVGMDDPEKIKSIAHCSLVWLEEATEYVQEDFEQWNLRLRGNYGFRKKMILSFNPISVYSWIKEFFYDQNDKNPAQNRVFAMTTTYKHNLWCDPDYAQELELLHDRNISLWRVYTMGLWGQMEGLVYSQATILSPQEWPAPQWFWHDDGLGHGYGVDFGYNHPMAVVECGIRNNNLYLREKLFERHLTTTDLRAKLKDIVAPTPFLPKERIPIYCDSAEPDRIDEIASDGWNVLPAMKGPRSVLDGINCVKAFAHIYICSDSPNLQRQWHGYAWAQDKEGRLLDQPVKFMDDLPDAARYYAYYSMHSELAAENPASNAGGIDVRPARR